MKLAEYKNKHKGQTAVIACNGPSLNKVDFSKFPKDVVVFGLNRGYLKKDMPIHYLVVVNNLVYEQFKDEIHSVDTLQTFVPHDFKFAPDVPKFETDLTKPIWQGHTVTFVAIQLANYMGFDKVILVGCDHNYPRAEGKPTNQMVVSESDDIDHFDKDYFGKGIKWHLPNLPRTEIAYKLAREYFESAGKDLVNCTPGTKLAVLRKGNLLKELGVKVQRKRKTKSDK